MAGPDRPPEFVTLEGDARDDVLPILKESFTGVYRWHAKKQLYQVPRVRALRDGQEVWGVSELDQLTPEVGYVYYLFVGRRHRHAGVGARLLDDALAYFRANGSALVYAASETSNDASIRLFRSRGFREVGENEPNWQEGGLGARGLRSRMYIVYGEIVLGLRFPPAPREGAHPTPPGPSPNFPPAGPTTQG